MTAPQTVADVQHTPGPWRFEAHASGSEWLGNIIGSYGFNGRGSEQIRTISCQTRYEGHKGEAIANAQLMAAAPALKDALDALLPGPLCGESWDLPDDETVQIATTFGKLRAARAALRAAATSARQGETK